MQFTDDVSAKRSNYQLDVNGLIRATEGLVITAREVEHYMHIDDEDSTDRMDAILEE